MAMLTARNLPDEVHRALRCPRRSTWAPKLDTKTPKFVISGVATQQNQQLTEFGVELVWPLAHPDTQFKITHARESVAKMLPHMVGRIDLPRPSNRIIEDGSRQPPQHIQ